MKQGVLRESTVAHGLAAAIATAFLYTQSWGRILTEFLCCKWNANFSYAFLIKVFKVLLSPYFIDQFCPSYWIHHACSGTWIPLSIIKR